MRNRKGNSAKGREGGWKRRKEVEEEDRRRGLDRKGMPREGDDEEDGGSKNDDGVRVGQREEGDGSLQEKRRRALSVRCEERERQADLHWDENQLCFERLALSQQLTFRLRGCGPHQRQKMSVVQLRPTTGHDVCNSYYLY